MNVFMDLSIFSHIAEQGCKDLAETIEANCQF